MNRHTVKGKIDVTSRQCESSDWAKVFADIDAEIVRVETRLSDLKKSKVIVKDLIERDAPFPGTAIPHP